MKQLPEFYDQVIAPWMKDQEVINKEIGKWMKQQEDANKELLGILKSWVEEATEQQREIDEMKLMVKTICKALRSTAGTSYHLEKTIEAEVPEDWQARMTWLTGNHL